MLHKRDRRKKESRQPGLFETGGAPPGGYAVMHCDGACSGNPGRAGIGVVINPAGGEAGHAEGNRQRRISEYIGIATNNIAEYSALIRGLEEARSMGIRKIKIFLDSELLVKQMNGIYRVRNGRLVPLFNRAKEILEAFESYKITHIRRERNKEADSLARQAVGRS